MRNSISFEPASFSDVYYYLEEKNNKKFNIAIKSILGVGALLFPVCIVPVFGLPSTIISDFATGATLAGAGVGKIVSDAIKDITSLFPKKINYKEKYMQMQIAYYLCLYAAFYDAVEECLCVEGHDIWKGYLSLVPKKIEYQEDNEETLQKFNIAKSFDCSNDEINLLYTLLTEEFKNHFYSLNFWIELGTDGEEQREYFDEIFQGLAVKAFNLFRQQLYNLSESFLPMRNWISQRSFDVIDTQLSNVKEQLGELEKQIIDVPRRIDERQVSKLLAHKDLYYKHGSAYYTFFEDECCKVDEMFILSNYRCGSIDIEEKASKIQNLEEIMNLALEQRFLLIAGAYGSGKTTLIKALHKKYKMCDILVFVFEARELADIVDEVSSARFIDFFESLSGKDETVVLIDAVDDLNIPNEKNSENSYLNFFLQNMYECIEQVDNIVFIISSRLYSNVREGDDNLITETCYFLAPKNLSNMRVVYSGKFAPAEVAQWIESYPFEEIGNAISKTEIKEKNGKIVSALSNPLFLYIFMKKYAETLQIQTEEGYYYYYEHFIDQTIKGKYLQEALLGARVIGRHAEKYRQLLQQVSFDILNHYSEQISSVIEKEKRFSIEPLLADELQRYRFSLSLTDFSETTKAIYTEMQSEEIDQANFINCYFLRMVREQIFFTDANILFILAAERIYDQLWRVIKLKHLFSLSDFRKIDAIDFYPQVLDYILFKIRSDKRVDIFKKYVDSFVTNDDIRNRIIVIDNPGKEFKEILAQIIMFYIIFIKLNRRSYIGNGYEHLFRELMHYVNAYKTYCYNSRSVNYVYTVEPYFMGISLDELSLKRTNLKDFNFQGSIIKKCNFFQCKLKNTILTNVEMLGNTKFSLCAFKDTKLEPTNSARVGEISFYDCTINELTFKPKNGKFERCYIEKLVLNLQDLQKLIFVDCTIGKIIFSNGNCASSALMEFSGCKFKTDVDIGGYKGTITFTSKCCYNGLGALLKNVKFPQKIHSADMIV